MKQSNYDIWDLENYKVDEPNKYSNVVDKKVQFDYFNREGAIRDLFETTTDPNVKQVLRFAMELNNQYRHEAMELYYILNIIQSSMRTILNNTKNAIDKAYL